MQVGSIAHIKKAGPNYIISFQVQKKEGPNYSADIKVVRPYDLFIALLLHPHTNRPTLTTDQEKIINMKLEFRDDM